MENLPPFPIMFEEWDLGTACEDIAAAWDNHGDIVVGNDVWIGYEAVILAGVTIGDGAIIGSRAVVTKDVPPYTIVGGLPAKPIRRRYDEETAARLEKLRWWDWPEAQVRAGYPAAAGRRSGRPGKVGIRPAAVDQAYTPGTF